MKKSIITISVIACLGLAYWEWSAVSSKPQDGSNDKNKPTTVGVYVVKKQDYPIKLTANGIVSSLNVVDVRAQVSSVIAKVHIKEGQFVKAGDLLFTLDNRADVVNLQKAQAQLDKELATLADNQRQLVRSQELFDKKFQSQSTVDSSQTLVSAQKSVVDAAKAAVAAAKVNLSYNRIVAPTSGRTGAINVFAGSLVQPSATGAALVTITQMHPIAISFPLPQRNINEALTSMKRGDSYALARLPEADQALKGKLDFVDNAVDAASGTVKVKAVFDNKDTLLWPGAYVNVELSVMTLKDAIVVPQEALIIGPKSNSLYVVNAEGNADMRQVKVEYNYGQDAVITGIESGAKVIVEGKQNLRPGMPVKERSANTDKPADKQNSSASASASVSMSASASAL